ncbi:MAG TPA: hypothetical protein VK254_01260 [Candidatus Bathyarchaeia archaeon]|nr:hypothetical protein [Candidatus Bathyarchaeia archaeon]
MPEMKPSVLVFDGEEFSRQDLKQMSEERIASIYNALTAGAANQSAIDAVSAELIDRGIF